MATLRQQKWVFCLQVEEVRESERAALDAAFRAVLDPHVQLASEDAATYIECERTHYDAWDLKCCAEAWFDEAILSGLPALIETSVRDAYPGPASNVRSWNGPALRSPGVGIPPAAQFRDVNAGQRK